MKSVKASKTQKTPKAQKVKDLYTVEQLRDMGIGHVRKVGGMSLKKLQDKQLVYVAETPGGWDSMGFERGTVRAYVWNGKKQKIEQLFEGIGVSKSKRVLEGYRNYTSGITKRWNILKYL